jgi:hypothetical protein
MGGKISDGKPNSKGIYIAYFPLWQGNPQKPISITNILNNGYDSTFDAILVLQTFKYITTYLPNEYNNL